MKESSKIVFLLGKAGSGKDTVGELFIKKGYTRIGFADAVRTEYAERYNVPMEHLTRQGPLKEKHRPNIIELAEGKRDIDPYYWANTALTPYLEKGIFKPNVKLVITDARRISDIVWYYNMLKTTTYLNADGRTEYKNFLNLFYVDRNVEDLDVLTHYTIGYAQGYSKADTVLPLITATIDNNGTLEELSQKVEDCFTFYNL